MRKIVSSVIASAVVAGGMVGVAAAPASASCAPSPGTGYEIYDKHTVYPGTNLASTWVFDNTDPTVSYNQSKTGTWTASGTAGVEAEAGVIFAKASTSFSVTVGKSWSHSDSWNYSLHAKDKAGKTQVRMRLFHEAKKFKVRKYTYYYDGHCKFHSTTKWRKQFTAPVKRNNNVWGLEYK
ncbi:hypothetical protein [Streptomyces sp. TLI_185]|uniref:hypothetical protein n=1 Tax=Streptomyces sp. TLI_185 TaxID=2485151 RepID=UPI000F504CCC|nr:hypothetical protein [Streptomyces sp. TLI_185]RPF36020.1 hypothetical protein EDD92_6047 [Streptomyces sp. TLI_185]